MRKSIIILSLFISFYLILRFIFPGHYFSLHYLHGSQAYLQTLTHQHYLLSILLYIVIFCFISFFALPSPSGLMIISGFLFNPLPAFLITMSAITIAAFISFYSSRFLFNQVFTKKYQKKLIYFNKQFEKSGTWYLLSTRLMPIVPFASINILAGLTTADTKTFLWTTFLGSVPSVIILLIAGKKLTTVNHPKDIFSISIIASLIILNLIAFIPLLINSKKRQTN